MKVKRLLIHFFLLFIFECFCSARGDLDRYSIAPVKASAGKASALWDLAQSTASKGYLRLKCLLHNPVMQEQSHWGWLEHCPGTLQAMPNIDYIIIHAHCQWRRQEPLYFNDCHKGNVWIKKCFRTFFFKTFFFSPSFAILPEMSEHRKHRKGTNRITTVEMSYSIKGKIGNNFKKFFSPVWRLQHNANAQFVWEGYPVCHRITE